MTNVIKQQSLLIVPYQKGTEPERQENLSVALFCKSLQKTLLGYKTESGGRFTSQRSIERRYKDEFCKGNVLREETAGTRDM